MPTISELGLPFSDKLYNPYDKVNDGERIVAVYEPASWDNIESQSDALNRILFYPDEGVYKSSHILRLSNTGFRTTQTMNDSSNGFNQTSKSTMLEANNIFGNVHFSFSIDGTSYADGVELPLKGEFRLHPSDVVENMHFYTYLRYQQDKLANFVFYRSRQVDDDGKFERRIEEIGTEGHRKDFATQTPFTTLKEGESIFIDDEKYNRYRFNVEKNRLGLKLNGQAVGTFPFKLPENFSERAEQALLNPRLKADPTIKPIGVEPWQTIDLMMLLGVEVNIPQSMIG